VRLWLVAAAIFVCAACNASADIRLLSVRMAQKVGEQALGARRNLD
jgi:hypothetical protein